MINIRICTVVTGKTKKGFLGNLEEIQEVADLVELRVDYIVGFPLIDIDLIKSKTKRQAIFTCRKKEEGGFFAGSESERVEILRKAIDVGFDYVDVELAAAKSMFEEGSHSREIPRLAPLAQDDNRTFKTSSKIILSFHDFTKTPTLSELEEIKKQMRKFSPDIMKFAVLVRDERDSKILFQFLLNKQDDEEMIVVGMGEKGRMTRVVAPLLGSYLTYASTDYSSSASGQVDIIRLKKLYNELGEL